MRWAGNEMPASAVQVVLRGQLCRLGSRCGKWRRAANFVRKCRLSKRGGARRDGSWRIRCNVCTANQLLPQAQKVFLGLCGDDAETIFDDTEH